MNDLSPRDLTAPVASSNSPEPWSAAAAGCGSFSTLNDIVIRRCRELAAGADPRDTWDGLCWELSQETFGYRRSRGIDLSVLYERLDDIFEALGLPPGDPLGDYNDHTSRHWRGVRGERRRILAGDVADYLQGRITRSRLAPETTPA